MYSNRNESNRDIAIAVPKTRPSFWEAEDAPEASAINGGVRRRTRMEKRRNRESLSEKEIKKLLRTADKEENRRVRSSLERRKADLRLEKQKIDMEFKELRSTMEDHKHAVEALQASKEHHKKEAVRVDLLRKAFRDLEETVVLRAVKGERRGYGNMRKVARQYGITKRSQNEEIAEIREEQRRLLQEEVENYRVEGRNISLMEEECDCAKEQISIALRDVETAEQRLWLDQQALQREEEGLRICEARCS